MNPLMAGMRAPAQMMQMLQQLKSNPAAFLKQRGYTVPDGTNDPANIIQYLASSGQLNAQQMQTYNQAMQGARNGQQQNQGNPSGSGQG